MGFGVHCCGSADRPRGGPATNYADATARTRGEGLTFGDNERREVESIPALADRYRVYCGLNDSDATVAAVLSDTVAGELASSLAIADYEIRDGVLVAGDRSVLKAPAELEALWHSMAWLSRALQQPVA